MQSQCAVCPYFWVLIENGLQIRPGNLGDISEDSHHWILQDKDDAFTEVRVLWKSLNSLP